MGDSEKEEETGRGFRVIDRRRDGRDGDEVSAPTPRPSPEPKQATEPKRAAAPEPPPEPSGIGEADFAQFLLSLATSASLHLGLIPHPETQKPQPNLPLAKQTIDILGMLQEKTQGNRNAQEEALLSQLVTDLRLRYVEANKKS